MAIKYSYFYSCFQAASIHTFELVIAPNVLCNTYLQNVYLFAVFFYVYDFPVQLSLIEYKYFEN